MSAHLYWRLNFSANNGAPSNVALAELALHTTVGGVNQATGGTASATNALGGYPAAYAFDGNPSTLWDAYTGPPVWLAYQLPSPLSIVEYVVTYRNDAVYPDAPKAWTFEYSDDGTNWTVAATVTGQTNWTLGQSRTFAVSTPPPVRPRRIVSIFVG